MCAEKVNVGIVGSAGRGKSFGVACRATGVLNILAVCDTNTEKLEESRVNLEAEEKYSDYDEMLERSDIQAVIIGTPMHLHVPMALKAMERNMHVLSEVTAGLNIDECRQLVEASEKFAGVYMLAEDFCYTKPNKMIEQMAKMGAFGDLYYAEGEYLHELKEMNEKETPWRRKWQTGIDGITYGTHSLGPILRWMEGDRVARVCCEATGSHHRDDKGEPYCQASSTMLCKTVCGALIKIRVDMLSDRPHSMMNYQLQGVNGAYESSRKGPGDLDKIWLRELSGKPEWVTLDSIARVDSLADKYVPECWRNPSQEALRAGHGGGDYFQVLDFADSILGNKKCPIGIHEAMDMTLPGLVSQQSIKQGGAWLDVPDSREWV